jgi:hypothetical protein
MGGTSATGGTSAMGGTSATGGTSAITQLQFCARYCAKLDAVQSELGQNDANCIPNDSSAAVCEANCRENLFSEYVCVGEAVAAMACFEALDNGNVDVFVCSTDSENPGVEVFESEMDTDCRDHFWAIAGPTCP